MYSSVFILSIEVPNSPPITEPKNPPNPGKIQCPIIKPAVAPIVPPIAPAVLLNKLALILLSKVSYLIFPVPY